jgi:hypothetical protein
VREGERRNLSVFVFFVIKFLLFLTADEKCLMEVNGKNHRWAKCQFLNHR